MKQKPIQKSSVPERIKELEEELSKTKYNKRTQHHIGLVKARIALLKEKQQKRVSSKAKSTGFSIKKSGDATVIIVGFPSVGKSTLLNALTNANSRVGHYAFTTLTCIPGLLEHKHAKIQILDVPGIVKGAAAGTGRGKEVLAVAQNADLVILLIDVFHSKHLKIIKKEVCDTNLRLDQKAPDVRIMKKDRGGIDIGSTVKLTKIDKKTIEDILKEFKLNNSSIVIRENIDVDQLIDIIEGNKKYVPSIIVLNKIDMVSHEELEKIKRKINPDVEVSADKKTNIEELKQLIFKKLNFVRIYCKEIGKKPDMEVPLIMTKECDLKDVCNKLHRDFTNKFRFARIWGKSAKFPGQDIRRLDHKLEDEDIVEVHLD